MRRGRLVGAHLLGDRADETINLLALAIRLELPLAELRHALHAYPLLFPAEIVSLVLLLATFIRSRTRHKRNLPLVLGLAAAACMFVGLRTPAPLGTVAALTGALAVVAVVVWDWQLQRRRAR